jgi:hypothetical protein
VLFTGKNEGARMKKYNDNIKKTWRKAKTQGTLATGTTMTRRRSERSRTILDGYKGKGEGERERERKQRPKNAGHCPQARACYA